METYLKPPDIIHSPGPDYAAVTRAFQGISSLACGRDGRLWAVWYGGPTPAEDENNYGIGESESIDGGATWSALVPSAVPHARSRFFLRRLACGSPGNVKAVFLIRERIFAISVAAAARGAFGGRVGGHRLAST
jgi:hypothetical protein